MLLLSGTLGDLWRRHTFAPSSKNTDCVMQLTNCWQRQKQLLDILVRAWGQYSEQGGEDDGSGGEGMDSDKTGAALCPRLSDSERKVNYACLLRGNNIFGV